MNLTSIDLKLVKTSRTVAATQCLNPTQYQHSDYVIIKGRKNGKAKVMETRKGKGLIQA